MDKPDLTLTDPSIEDLVRLVTRLTGREPTAAEIEEARAVLDGDGMPAPTSP